MSNLTAKWSLKRCLQDILYSWKLHHVIMRVQSWLFGHKLLEFRRLAINFSSARPDDAFDSFKLILLACYFHCTLSTILAWNYHLYNCNGGVNYLPRLWSEQHAKVLLPGRIWYLTVYGLLSRYCSCKLTFRNLWAKPLQIWATVLAMADLPSKLSSILYNTGIICFAIGTHYNRFSLWLYAAPVGVGFLILVSHWVSFNLV